MNFDYRVLLDTDVPIMQQMLCMFGRAFDDSSTYLSKQPGESYLATLLASRSFIAVAAISSDQVVGGLAAYVLDKFEQDRCEVYIYDLAVDAEFRRQGVATNLIRMVQLEARVRGASTVFVQADHEDEPAMSLYTKLGIQKDVSHFDIVEPDSAN